MTKGFVLITTEASYEKDVYLRLKDVDEVQDCYPLFGEYDILAIIEGDSDNIGMIVVEKIRTIKGIKDTKTLQGVQF